MSSARKTFGIIIAVSIIAYVALALSDHFTNNDSEILEHLEFDAVYLKNEQIVQISFIDKSINTKSAILEVLGMEKTYHQEFLLDNEDGFVDRMKLNQLPEYGWKTIPVTLEIVLISSVKEIEKLAANVWQLIAEGDMANSIMEGVPERIKWD